VIRFFCEHCSHKLSVPDECALKHDKCPACSNIVVVPAQSTVIDFHCEHCGRLISVPKIQTGRQAQCPKCKGIFVIPKVNTADDLALLDVPEEYKIRGQRFHQDTKAKKALEQVDKTEEEATTKASETYTQSNLPWIIDIFLYPTSKPGLTHLAFFAGAYFAAGLVQFVGGPLMILTGFPIFVMRILIGLYFSWYVTECIRDSAAGRIRAPEAFATADLNDMYSQWQHIVGCYLLFAGPAGFYFLFTYRTDRVFWLLVAYGAIFSPMSLLACVMFDSVRGLNPILLIPSIFSTLFPYCGLLLLIGGIILVIKTLLSILDMQQLQQIRFLGTIVGGLFYTVMLYTIFVIAHLLGRFYRRYEEKLNWEV